MSVPEDNPTVTTATPTEFFESIGKKADQLAPSTNGNGANGDLNGDEDDGKVVEQIESLCMNCHENVSRCSLRSMGLSVECR